MPVVLAYGPLRTRTTAPLNMGAVTEHSMAQTSHRTHGCARRGSSLIDWPDTGRAGGFLPAPAGGGSRLEQGATSLLFDHLLVFADVLGVPLANLVREDAPAQDLSDRA